MTQLAIRWEAQAEEDVDEHFGYIMAGNFAAAYCFIEDVHEAVRLLADVPFDFRRSEFYEGAHERTLAPRWEYTIHYERVEGVVVVLAVTSDRNQPGAWVRRRGQRR